MKNSIRFVLALCVLTSMSFVISYECWIKNACENTTISLDDLRKRAVSLTDSAVIPVAVIGSGQAGLSAALYAARAALDAVVFEGPKSGGQLTEASYIENWLRTQRRLGIDLTEQNRKQAEAFGTLMVSQTVTSVNFSQWPFRLRSETEDEVQALSVVIATGATPRLYGILGEKEYMAFVLNYEYWIKNRCEDTAISLADIRKRAVDITDSGVIPVAMIGSGQAGLSAALYANRAPLYTAVFEGPKPGGQLTETSYIENWLRTQRRLGIDLTEQNRKQAEAFGALMVSQMVTSVDFSQWPFRLKTETGDEVQALSVVIATDAASRLLGIPGEKERMALSFADIRKRVGAINGSAVIPVAVIGSGPAGLSAALYAARAAFYTVVFEGPKPGGQLTETSYVENWPGTQRRLGIDLIEQNRKQAEAFGALMVSQTIACVDFSQWPFRLGTEAGDEVQALSVVIATGAAPRFLGIPEEKGYFNAGVSTCAVCDAPFFEGKEVIVVGGGDSAVEEATQLAPFARSVTMMVRGNAMRAAPAMQQRLLGFENIDVRYNTQVREIHGNGTVVTDVQVENTKESEMRNMPIDGVFLAIGHIPNSAIFSDFLTIDAHGYLVVASPRTLTQVPGVFAAGDVVDSHYKQAGTAAGDGSRAGLDAADFLRDIGFTPSLQQRLQDRLYEPLAHRSVEPLRLLGSMTEFDQFVKEAPWSFVVFGMPLCHGCTVMKKYLARVRSYTDDERVHFAALDVQQIPEVAEKFSVTSVPVLLFFKEGKLAKRFDKVDFSQHELLMFVRQLVS